MMVWEAEDEVMDDMNWDRFTTIDGYLSEMFQALLFISYCF
jgi:hypothetical protein